MVRGSQRERPDRLSRTDAIAVAHRRKFPGQCLLYGSVAKDRRQNTWLVYDDNLNAYVDTGIEVGYANLLSRYDGKFAEIVVPCTEATNAAAAATVAANNAAAAANSAAGSASTETTAANTAAGKANAATTAANNAATAANTATGKANEAATAANNAAESAQRVVDTYDDVINTLAHSDCTLDERVEALEKALIAVLSGAVVIPKLQIKELNVWGNNSLAPSATAHRRKPRTEPGSSTSTRPPARSISQRVTRPCQTGKFNNANGIWHRLTNTQIGPLIRPTRNVFQRNRPFRSSKMKRQRFTTV